MGVPVWAFAVWVANSLWVSAVHCKVGRPAAGPVVDVDTFSLDSDVDTVCGLPATATGSEGCGSGWSAGEIRDASVGTLTLGETELPNVGAVVGTVSHVAVLTWLGRWCWTS